MRETPIYDQLVIELGHPSYDTSSKPTPDHIRAMQKLARAKRATTKLRS